MIPPWEVFPLRFVLILAKVITWRITSITITMILAYLHTGDLRLASSATLVLHSTLVLFHWLFEVIWSKLFLDSVDN